MIVGIVFLMLLSHGSQLYWGRTLVFEGKVVDAGMEYVFLGYNASGESCELALTFK